MKNWTKNQKIGAGVGVVVILLAAGFFLGWFGEQFSYKGMMGRTSNPYNAKKMVTSNTPYGKCTKHTSSTGGVWYTFGDVEVSASDCAGTL